jgi:hypothetical protein
MLAVLVNGVECADAAHAVSVSDRGLNYGVRLIRNHALEAG